MRVGDLVRLSSSGNKLSTNWAYKRQMGIIIQVRPSIENPYQIRWLGKFSFIRWFKRYEIKKVKPIS